MRIFKLIMMVTVLSFSFFFSLNNVSVKEDAFESLHKKDSITIDILTEGSEEESKKLTQQVLEDMKNHPEKVQFALPLNAK